MPGRTTYNKCVRGVRGQFMCLGELRTCLPHMLWFASPARRSKNISACLDSALIFAHQSQYTSSPPHPQPSAANQETHFIDIKSKSPEKASRCTGCSRHQQRRRPSDQMSLISMAPRSASLDKFSRGVCANESPRQRSASQSQRGLLWGSISGEVFIGSLSRSVYRDGGKSLVEGNHWLRKTVTESIVLSLTLDRLGLFLGSLPRIVTCIKLHGVLSVICIVHCHGPITIRDL